MPHRHAARTITLFDMKTMLTLSKDALELIAERRQSVVIDVPQTVHGCCIEITPCPSVRLGKPRVPDQHSLQQIQGADVFVPHDFPSMLPLSIRARKVLGRKFLAIDGWKLV